MKTNKQKRSERMSLARLKSTHTKKEWESLVFLCGGLCVFCKGESGLIYVEKDHILPVYRGGSDGIENLQPACARCNSSKGPDDKDRRPANWRESLNALL